MNNRAFKRDPQNGVAPEPTSQAGRSTLEDDDIVERIFNAVMDHRLRPGMKLTESALCAAFGVSRGRIRPILVKLGERGIVALHPNRGAFVASPTPEEAHDVFEARRTIELSVVRRAATRITKKQIRDLRGHVAGESAAITSGNRREAIGLSGQFHIRLAEVAGNPVLVRFVEELVARSSLIIALFGPRLSAACGEGDHSDLLDALESNDGARAARLMDHHLEHIAGELHTQESETPPDDLGSILRA